jgi:dynamin 1-like protein
MAIKYMEDPNTIILAVLPANQDITVADGLNMARIIDPKGLRTIGVFTKIDLMDKVLDAKSMLQGKYVPLRHGYVGVINRTQ